MHARSDTHIFVAAAAINAIRVAIMIAMASQSSLIAQPPLSSFVDPSAAAPHKYRVGDHPAGRVC